MISIVALLLSACGQSYQEQKRLSRLERQKQLKEDSAALKIAVMPTLDCLPMHVARHYDLFASQNVDIRMKYFSSQIDCDTALERKRVEASVTDLVRGQRLVRRGTALDYPITTNTYWLLITNKNSRIKELKQLDDKMLAMTRYSATDLLSDFVVDSVKLKQERVYRVQINDVRIRLRMMLNNEMDAMFVTEPQATVALASKNRLVVDSRKLDIRLGAIAFRTEAMKGDERKKQYDAFIKAYNMACDSINKHGVAYYGELVAKYCDIEPAYVSKIPRNLKFQHAVAPRQKDIERADKWLTAVGQVKADEKKSKTKVSSSKNKKRNNRKNKKK